MSKPDQQSWRANRVQGVQIIMAAMAIGVLSFLAVVLVIHAKVEALAMTAEMKIVTYIAWALGVVALLGSPLVASLIVSIGARKLVLGGGATQSASEWLLGFETSSREDDAAKLARLWITKSLISAAIYEIPALFLVVVYFIDRNPLTALCSAILLVALLIRMPTQDRTQRWIEEQVRQVEQRNQAAK